MPSLNVPWVAATKSFSLMPSMRLKVIRGGIVASPTPIGADLVGFDQRDPGMAVVEEAREGGGRHPSGGAAADDDDLADAVIGHRRPPALAAICLR